MDAALLSGESFAKVSRDYTFAPSSIRRHASAHLAQGALQQTLLSGAVASSDLIVRLLSVLEDVAIVRTAAAESGNMTLGLHCVWVEAP